MLLRVRGRPRACRFGWNPPEFPARRPPGRAGPCHGGETQECAAFLVEAQHGRKAPVMSIWNHRERGTRWAVGRQQCQQLCCGASCPLPGAGSEGNPSQLPQQGQGLGGGAQMEPALQAIHSHHLFPASDCKAARHKAVTGLRAARDVT